MKKITIRVSDTVYSRITDEAQKSKMSITDFLVSSALPNIRTQLLTLNDVITRVQNLTVGKEFSIPDLFSNTEWMSFTNGSHISVGRKFYSAWYNNEYDLKKIVVFLKKDSSNHAQYKRLDPNDHTQDKQ